MTKARAGISPERVATVIHGHAVRRLVSELASEEASELALQIVPWQLEDDASALAASIEYHHQPRLIDSSAEPSHAEAEGAMPTTSDALLLTHVLQLWLPDQ